MKLFELLKDKNLNRTVQGDAEERLKNIMEEAETMKKQMEDKLTQIQGSISALTCIIQSDDCMLQDDC